MLASLFRRGRSAPAPLTVRMAAPPGLAELAAAAATDDRAAQRQLYERLYAYGMSIALHYAGHRPEAEEIIQDAFVKLFRRLRQDPPTGNLRSYFGRIVVNAAIDLLRQRQRRPRTTELTDATAAHLGVSRNVGTDLLQRAEIYRLLQLLPPACRMVFNLHVLEGYKHPEIAHRLGISVGTSKSNLAKARQKLRALSATYYQIDENSGTDA